MNRYLKRIIIGAFIVPLLGFLYIFGVMYFYDPLQLFSEKYPGYYHENTRLSAKRVIDNYDFDSVVIGSSKSRGNNPKELKNGKYVNISMSNATLEERFIILKYLFNNKKILNVVMSLDGLWLDSNYNKDFKYLYHNYLWLFAYTKGLIPYKCFVDFSKQAQCIGIKEDFYNFRRDYINHHEVYKFKKDDFAKDVYENSDHLYYNEAFFEKFLLSMVSNNQKVIFHFFIPPNSSLYYKKVDVLKYVLNIKAMIRLLKKYNNVKIYFFGNEGFVDNMNNYIDDKHHYFNWVDTIINKAINEGTNIITVDNMDEEFDKFIKKVENYDIKAYEEALRLDIRE